jgi:DNA-binding Lrp family transcriptional regulator
MAAHRRARARFLGGGERHPRADAEIRQITGVSPDLASYGRFCWIASSPETRMTPFFVQIKCQLGKSYEVANRIADAEIASEIYSTAGNYDLLVKFYVEAGIDIGHFVNERVQTIPGIQDTYTIITFKAF